MSSTARCWARSPSVYAPTAQYHGPLMAELYGHASIIHQTLGLIGSLPDAAFTPQHICSTPCEEGGEKVAVRWIMEGHHLGYGILNHLGAPTGKRVQMMGITHFHYKNGKIVDEWRVYDEASGYAGSGETGADGGSARPPPCLPERRRPVRTWPGPPLGGPALFRAPARPGSPFLIASATNRLQSYARSV